MSMRLHLLCEALSSKFKLREACCLLLPAVITIGLSAEVSPAASDLPANQQVIAFLTESIDWYRHRAIERQIATEPVDFVFLEDNRPVAAQIVQLSFDFARADASVAATAAAGNQKGSTAIATGSSPDLAQFVQLENNAELGEQQATEEIEAIQKKLQTARGAEGRKLQAALDATQSRLDVLQAGLATLRQLVEFVRGFAGHETGDLASSIDDLARTVPDVSSPTAVVSQTQNSAPSSPTKPGDSGILALSSEVSALGRKLGLLDDDILRTDKLRQSSDDLRAPLLPSMVKRFQASAGNDLQTNDLRELQQQKARLDELAALVKVLSPAIVALDKQSVLLAAYTSHLKAWRAAVVTEDKKTWKTLISRLVGAAVLIGALVMIGAVVRRATRRHVHDADRRHIILVIQRVVLWFTHRSRRRICLRVRLDLFGYFLRASGGRCCGCASKCHHCRSWLLLAGWKARNKNRRPGGDFGSDWGCDRYRLAPISAKRDRQRNPAAYGTRSHLFELLCLSITGYGSV